MNCPTCGARIATGISFCPSCGSAINANPSVGVSESFQRPGLITALAILDFIGAAFSLIAGVAAIALSSRAQDTEATAVLIVGVAFLVIAVLYTVAGIGLLNLKPYGRILQILLAIVGLLGIPVGTIISILVLVYMFNPGIKVLFSGRPRETLAPEEIRAAQRVATGTSAALIVVLVFGGLLVTVFVLGIVAAIAVPGLLRARMAGNEASAIGQIRAIIAAEMVYAGITGAYGTIECLATPSRCSPGADSRPLIGPESQQLERSGYRFTFYPLDPVDAGKLPVFAIVATPIQPLSTGRRSFCGDATGEVCFTETGRIPDASDGTCSACSPLQR
jgi:type II secretory pathway pseudopilin PulG